MRIGIFHTAFVGDVVLTSLLIEGLSRSGHTIVLFSKNSSSKVFEGDPRIEKRIAVNKARGFSKVTASFTIARTISAENLDVLLVPHRSFHSAFISALSQVPLAVGFSNSSGAFLFNKRIEWQRDAHESIRYLTLGAEFIDPDCFASLQGLGRPMLPRSAESIASFKQRHTAIFLKTPRYFTVSPGSVWETKKYPPHLLAEAITILLARDCELGCVVNGGPGDEADVTELREHLSKHQEILARVHFPTALGLDELVTLTSCAEFAICNDSGPMHIASGVNTPCVAIFGPSPTDTGLGPTGDKSVVVTYSRAVAPLSCQPCSPHGARKCPLGHHRCMRELPPSVIVDSALMLLQKPKAQETGRV